MKTKTFLALIVLFISLSTIYAQYGSSLTFSEIMFYPSESNGEFVEIYNTSTTATIDLTNFKFKYYTSSNNNLVLIKGKMELGPGKYAVILQGSYDFTNGIYKDIIPDDAVILKTTSNSFGSSGMANTTSRAVSLINASGETVDTYTYSADNSAGFSDEKYIMTKDNSAANWKNSFVEHGSPGARNSISPLTNDLIVQFLPITPAIPETEDSVNVKFVIKNTGKVDASSFMVDLFNDANNDSIGHADELVLHKAFTSLAVDDSIILQKNVYMLTSGDKHFLCVLDYTPDENKKNNKAYLKFSVVDKPAEYNDIVINEFMYAPSNDEPEWIEFYNRSSRILNLKNSKIGDNTTLITLSSQDYYLNPGEFLVVSSDSLILNMHTITSKLLVKSIPALNNSGDDVRIKNDFNEVVDSLRYISSWGGSSGKSLERISINSSSLDQANWKESVSRFNSTPGKNNSVTPKNHDLAILSITSDFKYAVVGKNLTLKIQIKNTGANTASGYSIKLYKDKNLDDATTSDELISILSGTSLNPGATENYDYTDVNINSGVNHFVAEIDYAVDEFADNNFFDISISGVIINEVKGDLVINEIMYSPNSVEPEWLEIYNTSSKEINLLGYKIANHSSSAVVFNANKMLLPNEYFVIAKDSSILNKYASIPKILIASFPSLSNSGDKVIILDSLDRAIDSLEYKSAWGGSGGKSLEKVDAKLSSTDSTNWKTSINPNGASPGFVNSVSKKEFDLSVDKIIFNPQNPHKGEDVSIKAEVSNLGMNTASFTLSLFEVLQDSSKVKLEESFSQTLESGQSKSNKFNYTIKSLNDKRIFEVELNTAVDYDISNNKLTASINPGYPPQSVVINEVMYNPVNGEPEWVELYNNSSYDIDIYGWSISDVVTTPVTTILRPIDSVLPKNTFIVIVKDSTLGIFHKEIPRKMIVTSFANLNNDGDGVVIRDSRGVVIDSMRYDQTWRGSGGKSLERKMPSESSIAKNNWGSSKDIELSTPGRVNSLVQKQFDLVLQLLTSVPQFPSVGEEIVLSAKVLNQGLASANSFSVDFYVINGSDTTKFDEASGTNLAVGDSVFINSTKKLTIDGNKTVYAVLNFALDEETHNNFSSLLITPGVKKSSVLISEIMYDPFSGESEWVEIYNASSDQINLKNWAVSDLLPSPTKAAITTQDRMMNAGEYAIISSDTSKFPYYPPANFFQAKFGSLSTTDGVVIYDFRGAVIDSVKYNSNWGGSKGQSLERVSFSKATNDSTNWFASLSNSGATPGLSSSLASAVNYADGNLVINEIMYDPSTNNCEYLEFYNTTNDSIQVGGMQLKIGSSSKVKLSSTFLNVAPKEYFVLASDSSIFDNYSWLKVNSKVIVANSSFTLSNDGTTLLLKDLFNNTIDSVSYMSSWNNKNVLTTKNKSLERLNPLLGSNDCKNWSTCVAAEGATPGRVNSIFTQNLSRDNKVTISPNPFSPDNDGFEDFTIINFDLNKPLSQIRIRVYDSVGRKVRTIENYMPSASKNSIIFDGLDDSGRALRIGIYILLIETVDANGGNVETIKTPVVVARKL